MWGDRKRYVDGMPSWEREQKNKLVGLQRQEAELNNMSDRVSWHFRVNRTDRIIATGDGSSPKKSNITGFEHLSPTPCVLGGEMAAKLREVGIAADIFQNRSLIRRAGGWVGRVDLFCFLVRHCRVGK